MEIMFDLIKVVKRVSQAKSGKRQEFQAVGEAQEGEELIKGMKIRLSVAGQKVKGMLSNENDKTLAGHYSTIFFQ